MTEHEWMACEDPIAMVEFLRGSPTEQDAVTWWNQRSQFAEPAKGKDRKFRQFACACCRHIWCRIPEPCNRDAVAAVEEYLDGWLPGPLLEEAFRASSAVEWKEDGSGRRSEPGYWAVKYLGRGFYKMTAAASALLVCSQVAFMPDEAYGREARHEFDVCYYPAAGVFLRPFRWPSPLPAAVEQECVAQAGLLRDIFGNPFHPSPPLPADVLAWNDRLVSRLAQAAYDERHLPGWTLDPGRLGLLADALLDAGCDAEELLEHLRGPGPHVRGCWALDVILGKS
jgi:hypothetical protein